jgi:hypothetical protein
MNLNLGTLNSTTPTYDADAKCKIAQMSFSPLSHRQLQLQAALSLW